MAEIVQADLRQIGSVTQASKVHPERSRHPWLTFTLKDQRVGVGANPCGHEPLRLLDAMTAEPFSREARHR
ncbi:MAG TPA: hypothetical protein VFE35_03735 [Candidatus Cybelea sp.]|nr:hypothetical protein [Candidatus Cybelea sp.]